MITAKKINNWTTTKGYGNLIIKELPISIDFKNFKGISSLKEFKNKYDLKNGNIDGKYISVYQKLQKIQISLDNIYINETDPVKYLIYLYYQENLPIREITKRLKDIGIEYPSSSLNNLFTKTLGFELRDKYDKTDTKEKKDQTKAKNNKINTQRQLETKEAIDNILSQNKGVDIGFNINIFKTKKNKVKKITYLLYKFSFINEENENSLYDFLQKLSDRGLGGDRITNVLKTIINTYIISNNNINTDNLNIDPKLIWEILNKKKS